MTNPIVIDFGKVYVAQNDGGTGINPVFHSGEIDSLTARYADGSEFSYRDSDPSHVRQGRFRIIYESHPLFVDVRTKHYGVFSVDLVSGEFLIDGVVVLPAHMSVGAGTKLRLVYYKHMIGDSLHEAPNSTAYIEYFVIGWQTTTRDGRNRRLGLKVTPASYEVTEAI